MGADLSRHRRKERAPEGQDKIGTTVSRDGSKVRECEFLEPVGF